MPLPYSLAFRSIFNENERFGSTTDEKVKDSSVLLVLRRGLMERAWSALDETWGVLQHRMGEAGIAGQPAAAQSGVLSVNVGGSITNICRSVLLGVGEGEPCLAVLSNLISTEWDERLPRDTDGCIVIDESPVCMKYFIRKLVGRSGAAMGMAGLSFADELAANEKALMPHVHGILGLKGMRVTGGSTALKPDEVCPLTTKLQEWCPDEPASMELLYRGSRDGWTGQDFHSRCGDESPSTITLFRVSNDGPETTDSVVGGFSSVSWSPKHRRRAESLPRGAFLFMLKDGTRIGSTPFQAEKWDIKQGNERYAIECDIDRLPYFGSPDLCMEANNGMGGIIRTRNRTYNIPEGSPFLQLDCRRVIEIEVFRVDATGPTELPSPPKIVEPEPTMVKTGLIDLPASDAKAMNAQRYEEDIRSFGVSIADSLMEERVALHQAHVEIAQANAKAAASVTALLAMYGQDVAAKKEGAADVVELSVCGTRITTLRSTLQACTDSAFAARFDEDKWPPTEKDLDEHGRRVIDNCSPSVLSKVLDVLRMRKRAAWSSDERDGDNGARVVVEAADRDSFDEFVDMYFTGHESFIMDFVESP